MGKGWPHGVLFGPPNLRSLARRCIACHRPIVWGGDRCPDCYRKLRDRKRRKRR